MLFYESFPDYFVGICFDFFSRIYQTLQTNQLLLIFSMFMKNIFYIVYV